MVQENKEKGRWDKTDNDGGTWTSPHTTFLRQVWEWATPWAQVVGFIILCAFIIGDRSAKFDAYGATLADHDKRLMALEAKADMVNQKLDDMIYYFKVPHKE